ncbi:hypothetical protein VIOR103205_08285 [Vibrio ordalii]
MRPYSGKSTKHSTFAKTVYTSHLVATTFSIAMYSAVSLRSDRVSSVQMISAILTFFPSHLYG